MLVSNVVRLGLCNFGENIRDLTVIKCGIPLIVLVQLSGHQMSALHSRHCRGRELSRQPRYFVTVLSSQFPQIQRTARSSDHCHGDNTSRSPGINYCHGNAVADLAIAMVTVPARIKPTIKIQHMVACAISL